MAGAFGLVMTRWFTEDAVPGMAGRPHQPTEIDTVELLEDVLEFVTNGFDDLLDVAQLDLYDGPTEISRLDRQMRLAVRPVWASHTRFNGHKDRAI
jgi:hypothetical protein